MARVMAHPVAYPMAHPKVCIFNNNEEKKLRTRSGTSINRAIAAMFFSKLGSQVFPARIRIIYNNIPLACAVFRN